MTQEEELFDHQVSAWTAGQLRRALEGVADDIEVGDDTVLQRPDRHNVPRRPADQLLRLSADRNDLAVIRIERHHRRFIIQRVFIAMTRRRRTPASHG